MNLPYLDRIIQTYKYYIKTFKNIFSYIIKKLKLRRTICLTQNTNFGFKLALVGIQQKRLLINIDFDTSFMNII